MNERTNQKEKTEIDLNKKEFEKILKICLLSGIFIVSGFIIYYIVTPKPGFVTFGLLNSEGVAGDYPTNASVNEDIGFYALVENHLGSDLIFQLKIYKGNNQTQLSPTGSENAILNQTTPQVTINNEQRWISDILTISFTQIGSNQTVIVELWQLKSGSYKFYDITWLRLNITA